MTKTRQALGQRGEALAAEKLLAGGYVIVDRNYRCPAGELDIVARQGEQWVIVEVRTRRGRMYGTPEESITPRKRAHLIAAAQTYLQDHDLNNVDWRIDLVAVELSEKGQLLRVEQVENAVNAL